MSAVTQTLQNSVLWGGFRVWQRNRDAFLRGWKVEIGGIVVEPFIMLTALAFGLGPYVQDFGELSYAEFLAPGIVASYAMWHACFDTTYGAYLRMESYHIYEAILFTPLGPEDIVVGEIMSSATRGVMSSIAVLIAATAFGLVNSPLAVLAIPAAFLVGLMFASIAMVMTSSATTIGSINNFFTLFLLPMFWVCGAFFPIGRLPESLQIVAWALPLTPAVALIRGLMIGDLSWWMLLWTLELLAFGLAALWLASRLMRRRLIK